MEQTSMDMLLDLIGMAGQAKAAITGDSPSGLTSLSSVLSKGAETAKKYKSNMDVLQAQRDVIQGKINQGYANESADYNRIVVYNQLEEARQKMQAQIDNGDFDNTNPQEIADMSDKMIRELSASGKQSADISALTMNFMYNTQPQLLASHGERHRKWLKSNLQRETQIAMVGALKQAPDGSRVEVDALREMIPGSIDAATADALIAEAAEAMTIEGRQVGIQVMDDLYRKAPTQLNREALQRSRKYWQDNEARKYDEEFTNFLIEGDAAAESGRFTVAEFAARAAKANYFGAKLGATATSRKLAEWASTSKRKLSSNIDARANDGLFTSGMFDFYRTSGKNKAGRLNAIKVLRENGMSYEASAETLSRDLTLYGKAEWQADLWERVLMGNAVNSEGVVSDTAIDGVKGALRIYRTNPNADSVKSALGGGFGLVAYVDEMTRDDEMTIESAIAEYHLNRKPVASLTKEMNTKLDKVAKTQVEDHMKDYIESLGNVQNPEVALNTMTGYVTKEAKRFLMKGDTYEGACVQAIAKLREQMHLIDGEAFFESRPGLLSKVMGGDPAVIVKHFKMTPRNLSSLYPEKAQVPDPNDVHISVTLGGKALRVHDKTGKTEDIVLRASDVGEQYRAQKQADIVAGAAENERIANRDVMSKRSVLDNEINRFQMQWTNPGSLTFSERWKFKKYLNKVDPNFTEEDWNAKYDTIEKKRAFMRAAIGDHALNIRSTIKQWHNKIKERRESVLNDDENFGADFE